MSYIKKIHIKNFKCFKGSFFLELNEGINIIVGNNEAGKSTILEAVHLALSGLLNGRYIKNELSQYLFNKDVENEYIASVKAGKPIEPPEILIEVFFDGDKLPALEGDHNTLRQKHCGFSYRIEFDADYKNDYAAFVATQSITTLPIEYYKISVTSFAREGLATRSIPIKSALIDSASTRYQHGSDVYISRIIKDDLSEKEIVDLSQSYRKMKEAFMEEGSVKAINSKIESNSGLSSKKVSVSVDLSAKNSWETSLMTYLADIPFHQIGKGEQCLIKTNLALAHKKTVESNIILIEEPENHLSHSMLNQLIKSINEKCEGKQILITTHSSFVANKLQLNNLILLHNQIETRLNTLKPDTFDFFSKLSGYETLRMILCKKAILVEGPSDELLIQRAYMDRHQGALPIENGIDVISVAMTFKRFLEVADILKKPIAVVTDNDGNYANNIVAKYKDYDKSETIKICADNRDELYTLEPQLVDANKDDLDTLRKVLGIKKTEYKSFEAISDYMQKDKAECALRIFNATESIKYPQYIQDAVNWCEE